MKKLLLTIAVLTFGTSVFAQSLEDRVSELEVAKSLDIFEFSGDLNWYYDNITDDQGTASGTDDKKTNWNRIYFALNMSAVPYDDVKFYGRLSMSKFWNEMHNRIPVSNGDLGANRAFNTSNVMVEKAYFDWAISKNLIFSAGRIPTLDGPPTELPSGNPRMGTFPRMSRNTVMDGLGISYSLGKFLPENQNLNIRVIHSPINNPDDPATSALGTSSTKNYTVRANYPNTSDVHVFQVDYSLEGSSLAKSFNAILQLTDTGTIPVPAFETVNVELQYITAHVDADNIANLGLSASLSYVQSSIDSKGQASMTLPGPYTHTAGFLTTSAAATTEGSAILAALRYQLPVSKLKNPFIGLEYLTSDKGFYFADAGGMELDDFYGVKGTGLHIYYTQPIKDTFTVRIGHRQKTTKYGGSVGGNGVAGMIFGDQISLATDKVTSTTYLVTELSF